jgi:hypothetical protein
MEEDTQALQFFGRFLMEHLRDRGILWYEYLAQGKWKSGLELQTRVVSLNAEQREIIRQCVILAIDTGIHDFLFQLGVNFDMTQDNPSADSIKILVNGIDIAQVSDGLQGEAYGENGWIHKYSKYK